MSMSCKQCGEGFAKGQSYDIFALRREKVMPSDAEGLITHTHTEDAGVFCSRRCVTDYLKAADKSGVFGLGMRKA